MTGPEQEEQERESKDAGRSSRICYNPRGKGDCGFQAVLAAASRRPTRRAVRTLRSDVAKMLIQKSQQGQKVLGIEVMDFVKQAGDGCSPVC